MIIFTFPDDSFFLEDEYDLLQIVDSHMKVINQVLDSNDPTALKNPWLSYLITFIIWLSMTLSFYFSDYIKCFEW